MEISKETLAILKNFASVNPNLLFRAGSNVINTISISKSVYASYTCKEQFPVDYDVYDLNEFLAVVALFDNPQFVFNEKCVEIREGQRSVRYFGAAQEVLVFPRKPIVAPTADIVFNVTTEQIQTILRVASVLKSQELSFVGTAGGVLQIIVGDSSSSNAQSNSYTMSFEDQKTDNNFNAKIKIENLKIIPGNYTVQLAAKKIARFVHADLEYIVVLEQNSEF